MMFSERLGHGKCDFQHLQGTMRAQKPDFQGPSELLQGHRASYRRDCAGDNCLVAEKSGGMIKGQIIPTLV